MPEVSPSEKISLSFKYHRMYPFSVVDHLSFGAAPIPVRDFSISGLDPRPSHACFLPLVHGLFGASENLGLHPWIFLLSLCVQIVLCSNLSTQVPSCMARSQRSPRGILVYNLLLTPPKPLSSSLQGVSSYYLVLQPNKEAVC